MLSALSMVALTQPKRDAPIGAPSESTSGDAMLARAPTLIGTVEEVDLMQRRMVLKNGEGRLFTLTAGPDVRNLERVKAADRVRVRYLEALSLALAKNGKEVRSGVRTEDAARVAAGDWPAGTVAHKVQVTARVVAVNTRTRSVTLRGPKQVVNLLVRDPSQLRQIRVGDQIDAVYAEALALFVDPAAPVRK